MIIGEFIHKIIYEKSKKEIGKAGIVIYETRKTLILKTIEGKQITIPKENKIFFFNNKEIYGKALLKKKRKFFIF
jgi:RNase P/RNase MRP subunit p29